MYGGGPKGLSMTTKWNVGMFRAVATGKRISSSPLSNIWPLVTKMRPNGNSARARNPAASAIASKETMLGSGPKVSARTTETHAGTPRQPHSARNLIGWHLHLPSLAAYQRMHGTDAQGKVLPEHNAHLPGLYQGR